MTMLIRWSYAQLKTKEKQRPKSSHELTVTPISEWQPGSFTLIQAQAELKYGSSTVVNHPKRLKKKLMETQIHLLKSGTTFDSNCFSASPRKIRSKLDTELDHFHCNLGSI